MKSMLLTATALAFAATLGAAQAAPINGTFALTIWHTTTAGGSAASPDNQALPTNPLTGGAALGTGTYTGPINFSGGGAGTIGQFLASGGGTVAGFSAAALATTDSAGGFQVTTLYEFTGATGSGGGTVTHDDGASLFQGGVNHLPAGASAPTVSVTDTFTPLSGGTFDLWYVEANGLPAVLRMDQVPEPMSLALLGGGLFGLGLIRRLKK